jgi:hypothetical protein
MAAVLEQFAPLLQAIADVARGDDTSRAEIEQALPQLEQNGWMIADATRRIWAGERDAAALTAGLDANSAMLVRRVLEVLAGAAAPEAAAAGPDMAAVLASLPEPVRVALEQQDGEALQRALESLSPEQQQAVLAALQPLMQQSGGAASEEQAIAHALEQLAPLLQAVAAVAQGDDAPRAQVEAALAQLEQQGVHLQAAVQRIWAGERDAAALTAGLDAIDSALVRRVLEVLAGAG